MSRGTLLFVSTRFLFPVDSGGKIRTTQILRGLKGGQYRVVLASPATEVQLEQHRESIEQVCDVFEWWPEPYRDPFFNYTRLRFLASELPIPVRTDRHAAGLELVANLLQEKPDVVVFDFAHAAVLAPETLNSPSLIFTHNVEAEIFRRHVDVAGNPLVRALWQNQYRKMHRFESAALKRFDAVVAVADRDAEQFLNQYDVHGTHVIPTGVDLDFFSYSVPDRDLDVVFCGSMDWLANQDGISWFMQEAWQGIATAVPDARMTVVGRAPPDALVKEAAHLGLNWHFTGFVDDVRPYMRGAAVAVIPLRVGGGTRLKAYESMAMGNAIVSTTIGMEGLPVSQGEHYLCADDASDFAESVVSLLQNSRLRKEIAERSRKLVEDNFSYQVAARSFEAACEKAVSAYKAGPG